MAQHREQHFCNSSGQINPDLQRLTDSHPPHTALCVESRRDYVGSSLSENPPACTPSGEKSHLLERIHAMTGEANNTLPNTSSSEDINYLSKTSLCMVEAINSRDFSNPLFRLATPDFKAAGLDIFPPTVTPSAHLDKFRAMAEEHPEYRMHVDDVTVDLQGGREDEGGEWAKVYLSVRAEGRPKGLVREALGVLTWRRRDGKGVEKGQGWRLVAHESMRVGGL